MVYWNGGGRKAGGTVWRNKERRIGSAYERLKLAESLWRWQPHPAQRELFCSGASVRVAACGRRWGKTESLSVDIATLALAERGCRQLVVAPTESQARLTGEAVLDRLEKALARGGPDEQGRTLVVRARPHLVITVAERDGAAASSQVLCRTAGRDGRSLRGLWAHRIIVDEAAYVPDRVLSEVLPPMLADKGGEFLLASSPSGRRSAFYRLYALGFPPLPPDADGDGVSYEGFQCATAQNEHLDRAWLRSQRDEMGELLYAQEYEAKFIDDFGMVFREEDVDAAVTDLAHVALDAERLSLDSDPEPGRCYVAGIDWGRKLDYTVVAVLDAEQRPFRLVHLSRWRATGWHTQAQDAARIVVRFRPRRVLADGSSIGDPIADMLDGQIASQTAPGAGRPTVERFTFGSESKQALIDGLNVALSARTIQFPPHPALVHELKNFEYAAGGPGRLKMAARGSGHDDCVIALALALHCAPDPAARSADFGILFGSQLGLGERDRWR